MRLKFVGYQKYTNLSGYYYNRIIIYKMIQVVFQHFVFFNSPCNKHKRPPNVSNQRNYWGYIIMIYSYIQQECGIQAFQISGEHSHHPSREGNAIKYSTQRCLERYTRGRISICILSANQVLRTLKTYTWMVQTRLKPMVGPNWLQRILMEMA